MKKHLGFALGSSIAVLLCVLLPGLASAKEMPQWDPGEGSGLPSACEDPSNLVQNCGFETGTFAMWTQGGDLSFTSVAGGAVAHTGRFGASLGPLTPFGTLSQRLTTTPGGRYFITFWLRNNNRPAEFGVVWDGILYWGWPNLADFPYSQVAIGPVPASTASTEIMFLFYNTPDFIWLDDIVVYAAGGGPTDCTMINQPVGSYLTQTRKCDISRFVGMDTTRCVNTDGSTAANFVGPVNVRRVTMGWATWSSPPDAEEAIPFVGYNNGALTEMIGLVNPAAVAGVEVEPNTFDPFFTIVASFRDAGGNEVASVTRDVTGRAGARLFAVSCSNPVISSILITSPPAAAGFAIAQIRSDTIVGGATEEPSDVQPQPVAPNATSNTQ